MEMRTLVPIATALVVLFALIGTGVLMLDKYSQSIYTEQTINNESVKFVTNGSTVTLAYDKGDNANVITSLSLKNKSGQGAVNTDDYTVTDLGVVTLTDHTANTSQCINSAVNCYAFYTYKNASGTVNDIIDAGTAALGDVNDTWGSLLVTVIVLVLIITLLVTALLPMVRGRN